MKYITINEPNVIVNDLLKAWDLHKSCKNYTEDIKSAIEEAYILGCLHGRIDDSVFKNALHWLNLTPNSPLEF